MLRWTIVFLFAGIFAIGCSSFKLDAKPSRYSDLIQLDDLLDKEIITQEEYEREKREVQEKYSAAH